MKGVNIKVPRGKGIHRRRLGLRTRLLMTLVATTGCVFSITTLASAVGTSLLPSRLLQAVDITLGPDGSVEGLKATDISQIGSSTKATSKEYSPREDAGQLPVSVTVSYSDDGATGTNLKDLKGKGGTIEVDYTVTNETVHPQQVTYATSGGQTETTWALVADPITVVASAQLPKGSFSEVQAPDSGSGPQASQSNGVIQSGGTGYTDVQWATILAPPALASVTTFRLVEQTTKFVIPKFVLTAEQGLITDPTTQELVESAFGGVAGGGVDLLTTVENATVDQMHNVQLDLAEAADQLGKVQNQLGVTTAGFGEQAESGVTAADSDLQNDAATLNQDLQSLETSMTSTLNGTETTAESALAKAVTSLVDYIGIGVATTPSLGVTPSNCTVQSLEPASGWASETLADQLNLLVAQVQALENASNGCQQTIDGTVQTEIASLGASLGDANTAINSLVSDLQTAVSTQEEALASALDTTVSNFANQTATARSAVDAGIASANSDAGQTQNDVDSAFPKLVKDNGALGTDASGVSADAGGLSGSLGTQSTDLSEASTDLGLLDQELLNVGSDLTTTGANLHTANGEISSADTDLAKDSTGRSTDLGDLSGLAKVLGLEATTDASQLSAVQSATIGKDLDDICQNSDQSGVVADATELATLLGAQACGVDPSPESVCDSSTPLLQLLGCVGSDLQEEQAVASAADGGATSAPPITQASWQTAVNDASGLYSDLSSSSSTTFATLPDDTTKDSTDLSSASTDLSDADGALSSATSVVSGSGSATQLDKDINQLQQDIQSQLSDINSGKSTLSTDVANVSGDLTQISTSESNYVAAASGDEATAKSDVASEVTQATDESAVTLAGIQNSLEAQISSVFSSATSAEAANENDVNNLLTSLASDLANESSTAESGDDRALQKEVTNLNSTEKSVDATFSKAVTGAITSLDAAVQSASSELTAAQKALLSQLSIVMADLGANGVVGYVKESAASTGTNESQVDQVANSSQEFGSVREQEIGSQALAAAQLVAGIADSQASGAFEASQSSGSSHTSVFVFTLAGS